MQTKSHERASVVRAHRPGGRCQAIGGRHLDEEAAGPGPGFEISTEHPACCARHTGRHLLRRCTQHACYARLFNGADRLVSRNRPRQSRSAL